MPSPSAGATARVPASTPSNTCGPSVSATQLKSWNMSEFDLPIDPAITIQAETSLVDRLFALPGVAYVLIADNVVTVGKEAGASWSGLRPAIGTGLRTLLLTGIPAILEATANAGTRERTDAESRAVVQQLLDREINRSIAAHGGQISIVDVRDGNLFIAMSGGGQGCSASKVTLRQGVEGMLRRGAAEIANIVDTTD